MIRLRSLGVRTRPARVRAGLATLGMVFAMLGGALMAAAPAAAHAVLVDSSPEQDEELDEVPTEVVLVFNEPVQGDFSQVAVLDADDNHYEVGDPEIDDAEVTQAVGELAPGDYLVTYRVGSADGHPVTGAIEFTILEGATPAPAPTDSPEPDETSPAQTATPTPTPVETPAAEVTPSPTPAAATDDTEDTAAAADGSSLPIWLAAAVAALVAISAVLIVVWRRPDDEPDGTGADTGP